MVVLPNVVVVRAVQRSGNGSFSGVAVFVVCGLIFPWFAEILVSSVVVARAGKQIRDGSLLVRVAQRAELAS